MFGMIAAPRGPAARKRPDVDRVVLFTRGDPTGQEDREGPAAGPTPARQTSGDPPPGPRTFEPKSRGSSEADLGRARRLLAADLTYIPHPSFDDPTARDAILAPAIGFEGRVWARTPARRDAGGDSSPEGRFPTRERETHAFRKLNYLKFLACRVRDGIDPDSPAPGELDEVERLRAEALTLRNRIVETHLPLAIFAARRYVRAGYDLSDRVSDAAFALMRAVDRFDFARGTRFGTYATWAIIKELAGVDRKQRRRGGRAVALDEACHATGESEGERYERDEAQEVCRAAVERLLVRLDWRERRILEYRHGIGRGPEYTLEEIGRDLGISKERVRQLEQRAHAKLRGLAHLEAIGPSSL